MGEVEKKKRKKIASNLQDVHKSSYFKEVGSKPVLRKQQNRNKRVKEEDSNRIDDTSKVHSDGLFMQLEQKISDGSEMTPTLGRSDMHFLRSFYDIPCENLAKNLLGQILVRRLECGTLLKGRIVETECYLGGEDEASHSCKGKVTDRNRAMFMSPGTIYVYMTYGMYYCFNISSQGDGAAVLLRSLEPLEGLEYMEEARRKKLKSSNPRVFKPHELCNGPSKLCISFNIDKAKCNQEDLTTWEGMWIEKGTSVENNEIVTSHRIGIESVGGEWAKKPLRFYVLGNTSVSKRDKSAESCLIASNQAAG